MNQSKNPENMSVRVRFICFKVSALSIFLLLFQSVSAQYNFAAVDQKLEAFKKELGGYAAIMVVKNGKPVYQKSVGAEFNVKTQVPVANCCQWLTAALVMTFVDQGKLSLDDKVSKYIPDFSKYSKGYITIRDCLAHLDGIETEPVRLANLFGRKKYKTLEEEVEDFAAKREIVSNPALEFRYGNVGLNIAGRVLEVITKRSFEQLMQERITRPLAMRNTSFSSFTALNPSSGGLSTVSDYSNFLTMLLNKGVFNGKQILSAKAITEMQTVRTTPAMIKYAPAAMEGYSYGFGEWILEADENGIGNVIASPGMAGSWPLIDKCRGYSLVIFTKGDLGDDRKNIFMEIKNLVDEQIKPECR